MRRPAFVLVSACLAPAAYAADVDAVVAVKEVVVHAAPGDLAPDCGTLPKGTRLLVHHEEPGGWLAVQPPNGSVSWVNHRFLDFGDAGLAKLPTTATIRCGPDGIEIEAGKFAAIGPLNVRRTKLANETMVTVMGPKVQWAGDNSYWYPIWSPNGDYRYVRRDGIQAAVADTSVVRSSAVSRVDQPIIPADTHVAGVTPLPPGTTFERLPDATAAVGFKATKPADWPSHPLWKQAESADKVGDWDRAERLYFQLAGEMNKPGGDAELANLSYSRIHSIRERRRLGKGGDAVLVKNTTPAPTPAPTTTGDIRLASATTPAPAATPAARTDAKETWYGPGTLYVSIGKYQDQPVYALESEPGRVVAYCVPAPGFDLQPHLRKKVALMGKVLDPNYSTSGALVSVSLAEAVK